MMNVDNQMMSIDAKVNLHRQLQSESLGTHPPQMNPMNMDYKSMPHKSESAMQSQSTSGVAKKKRKRCGSCAGCYRKDNCLECGPCKSTRSHQICKMRKCEQLKTKKEKQREELNAIGNNPVHSRMSAHIQSSSHQIQTTSHLSHHLSSHLNQNPVNTGQPSIHPSFTYSNQSSTYQTAGVVSNGSAVNNAIINPSTSGQSHPNGLPPSSASNPLMHLQHTASNAYHSGSMNSQNCVGLPVNTMNMSNNLHPSNTPQMPPNQIMHSNVPPHMRGTEADQMNGSRQQMTTNSRLKSFIQNRQHSGINTKTPGVYSPTQSPIGYNNNNFNPSLVNGNSLSPHYITTPSPGHQSQYAVTQSKTAESLNNVNSNVYHESLNQLAPTNESLKTASQHSVVANAAAGYFSRHTGNGLNNGQVTSQRLSGLSSQADNQQLTNGTNIYANAPHSQQLNYANPSLYYGSPNSQQPYTRVSISPSSSINRNSGNKTQPQPPPQQSSTLQQQLIGSHQQQPMPPNQTQYTTSVVNPTTSPSLNVSHNSTTNSMMGLSHRSKSVDLLNSNDNSNGSSSHSTSSLGQQVKMNNAQSPLNSLLNSSNNSKNLNNATATSSQSTIKTSIQQDAYFNSSVTSTSQIQPQSTTPINSYYGLTDNTVNNAPTSTTTSEQDQQTNSLSNLLMDIGSSSPSTTSSLAVTSLATYASLGLDDQFETATTLSSSSSTVTTNQTVATGQQASSTTAILNNSTNNSNSNTNLTQSNNSQLPPVSTFILPHFRDASNYWWESQAGKAPNSTSSATFNYTGHNLQPTEDELHNAASSNGPVYFSSLEQYSAANGSMMSTNYDYQYNGYHADAPAGEYNPGFTSLTSTL